MTQSENLPDLESTKLRFTGVKYQSLNRNFKRGDEHEFIVRGTVVMVGEETLKDGHAGQVVKLDVLWIRPTSFEEPEDPNQPTLLGADD